MLKHLFLGATTTLALSMPAEAADFSNVLEKIDLPPGFKISRCRWQHSYVVLSLSPSAPKRFRDPFNGWCR